MTALQSRLKYCRKCFSSNFGCPLQSRALLTQVKRNRQFGCICTISHLQKNMMATQMSIVCHDHDAWHCGTAIFTQWTEFIKLWCLHKFPIEFSGTTPQLQSQMLEWWWQHGSSMHNDCLAVKRKKGIQAQAVSPPEHMQTASEKWSTLASSELWTYSVTFI